MIVPYPPGGGTDGFGRITCQFLSEKLGQQIIVQNIGGASGTVGSDTVRRADPDGYTLAVQCEPVRAGQDGGAVLPLRSADRLPGDRPGGRGAAGADRQQQRAGHRLCQHDGGDRQGAEEVLLRPVVGRLGRPYRHARVPEAHRPAARHHPLQGHGAGQRRPAERQRAALHGSVDGDCCRSPPRAARAACSSPPRSARRLRPTSRPPTRSG